ncbi:MAG TPA: DUF58 domain-containing protein [Brachybacterium sp.]|nr:DUF58 domain-containing protein [Brachybacterium sp.]
MTSAPPPSAVGRRDLTLRLRPTPAFFRAAAIAGAALALAVLRGSPALIAAGLPLLAWCVVSLAWRTARAEEDGIPGARMHVTSPTIEEGGTSAALVTTAPGVLTSVTLPRPAHVDLAPRCGSLAGDGSARIRLTAHRWGLLPVGPAHVLVSDPFGAVRAQQTLPRLGVKVVPSASVLDAPVTAPSPIGISGAHLSARHGDGTALSEVREFRPGDRLHRINWRVTNRTGKLHTNATFTEQDTDVLIVTDTISDVQPAPWTAATEPTSLDMTIRATTAVARHYLAAGDRVSLFDIGHLIGPVRAGAGPRQLRVLTDALSRAGRRDGTLRAARRLQQVRPGTLTVVCSPLLEKAAITQIGELVSRGAEVIVVDTLPASIGDVSVLTGRAPRAAGLSPDRFWPEAWALRRLLRERTVRDLEEAGVPVTPWEGPSSLAPVLLSLTRARTAPRMRRS